MSKRNDDGNGRPAYIGDGIYLSPILTTVMKALTVLFGWYLRDTIILMTLTPDCLFILVVLLGVTIRIKWCYWYFRIEMAKAKKKEAAAKREEKARNESNNGGNENIMKEAMKYSTWPMSKKAWYWKSA